MRVIVECLNCRQKNRVIVGTTSRCGACKHVIAGHPTQTLDNFADRLNAADASMAFGRMHFPQDYVACARCGVTTHKRDSHTCAPENV